MLKQLLVAAAATFAFGAQAQQAIKVGVINIDGGPFTMQAAFIRDAAVFAIDQLNARGGALGRKYELVEQTHTGTPAAAIAAAQNLVNQKGVSFFAGLNGSATALAIASKMDDLNALFLDPTASAADLTGKYCQKNYFRTGVDDTTAMNGYREVVKASGIKSWDLLVADYSSGHSFAKQFTAIVNETGGKVNQTLFAPLAAPDLGSYISQLMTKPAEGMFVMYPGSAAIALAKQQQPFGLFSKYKQLLSTSTTNEYFIDAQGDTTAGMHSAQSYLHSLPGAMNEKFVKDWVLRYKRKPNYLEYDTVLSYEILHQAILKAKSTEVAAVRTALTGLKIDTVLGPMEMRAADHQLVRPLVIVQAVKSNVNPGRGEIVLKVVQPASLVSSKVSPECKMGT